MEEGGLKASDPFHHGTMSISRNTTTGRPRGGYEGSQMPFGEKGFTEDMEQESMEQESMEPMGATWVRASRGDSWYPLP